MRDTCAALLAGNVQARKRWVVAHPNGGQFGVRSNSPLRGQQGLEEAHGEHCHRLAICRLPGSTCSTAASIRCPTA